MVQTAFVGKGHGYEAGSQGRCGLFDGFDVIANPLGGFDAAVACREAAMKAHGFGPAHGRTKERK